MATDSNFAAARDSEIKDNQIIIYGKGTKVMPMCGFTARVIDIFKNLGKPFHVVNVLEQPDFREQMKLYSQWPTFPQIYIKGELVGGCDIVSEMHEKGELEALVK